MANENEQNVINPTEISPRMRKLLDSKAGEGSADAKQLLGQTVVSEEKKENLGNIGEIVRSLDDPAAQAENKKILGETESEGEVENQNRKEKITQNLEFVLGKVPALARSNPTEHSKYMEKIEIAKKELLVEDINVDEYIWAVEPGIEPQERNKLLGQHKAELREMVRKMRSGENLTDEENEIAQTVNIKAEDLVEGTEEERKGEKNPIVETSVQDEEKKKLPKEQVKGQMWNIQTEDDLNTIMADINKITDPTARARRLGKLADDLYNKGKTEWGNIVAEERTRQVEIKSTANIIGLPEDRESESEWRKWARARMARVLDPLAKEGSNSRDVFGVISESPFGRQNADGSLYMPKDLSEEIVIGKTGSDGRIEKTSEFQVSQEMGKLYSDWRKAHRKLNLMVAAIESGEYRLPDNRLNRRLLNELKSEDGSDPEGGSKNIAKALQIYWAMAHGKEVEGQEILGSYGLGEIKSIFNNQLTIEDIGEIRNRIAGVCGGTYYENIGLMYASFYGVSAYGSDSTLPRIEFGDAMGNLVYSEINRYKNDNEKFNATRRGYRYLGDTVANSLYEVRDGRKVLVNGEPVPVELGAHSGSLQTQVEIKKEPRVFYILRSRGTDEKFKIVKKVSVPDANGVIYGNESAPGYFTLNTDEYEEVLFDDMIKEGRINEIDWGNSIDVSPLMVSREKGSINVYKMFKNLDDELAKLTEATLIARKENFEDALPQYSVETQHHVMYLWLHSLINKNEAWRFEKKDELVLVIKNAAIQGLISENEKNGLIKGFRLGILGDATKLTDGTYSPRNMFKQILGIK